MQHRSVMKVLEQTSFAGVAERVSARYDPDEETLLLVMFGQEYVIRREGIFLHGQNAPEAHALVIADYLASPGTDAVVTPWKSPSDFTRASQVEFRRKIELPVSQYAGNIIERANAILPMCDARPVPSLIGNDMALDVRALPKVYLHLEISQETQDFPPEAWVLFSNNAHKFLPPPRLQALAEIFKDRLLSLLRIY